MWGSCSRVWLRGCSWMTDSSRSCSKCLRWKTCSLKFEKINGPPLPCRHVVAEHQKRGMSSSLVFKAKALIQVVFSSGCLMLTYQTTVFACIYAYFSRIMPLWLVFLFWNLSFIPPSNSAHANLLSVNQALNISHKNHYTLNHRCKITFATRLPCNQPAPSVTQLRLTSLRLKFQNAHGGEKLFSCKMASCCKIWYTYTYSRSW